MTILTLAPAQSTLPVATASVRGRKSLRRGAAIALVLAAGLSGLTACQTKVGEAAVIGNYKISPEDVDRYVDFSVQPSANAWPIAQRRSVILSTLIEQRLDDVALNAHGGSVTDSERSSAMDLVLQGGSEDDLKDRIKAFGVKPEIEPTVVGSEIAQQVLATRLKLQASADVVTAIVNVNAPVSVSARYGTWDPQSLGVGGFTQPSFLLPTPTPTPDPSAQGQEGQ